MPKNPSPTDAVPGTYQKILILAERARLGQDLFVKGDADTYADIESETEALAEVKKARSCRVDKHAASRQAKRETLDDDFRIEMTKLLRNGGCIGEVTMLRTKYFEKMSKRSISV